MSADAVYLELLRRAREHTVFASRRLLEWDEDACMPGGAEHRAEQQALLARLLHTQTRDARVGRPPDRSRGEARGSPGAR